MNNISLHYQKPGIISLQEKEIKLKKNQILINVKSCGMCGTDLKVFLNGSSRVKKNRVLGHEISGQILSTPDKQNYFKKNMNIILGADIPNKLDKDFALGHEIDGGFQKYLVIDQKLLKKVPHFLTKEKINYEETSLTEPLACCLNGVEKINLKPNKNILIIGSGTIGQLIAKLCLYFKSKKVYLIDKNKKKLKIGNKNKKIIKLNYDLFKRRFDKKKISEINYIFVACSSKEAQNNSLEFASKNATINFFAGLPVKKGNNLQSSVPLDTNLIHYKQLRVVGSHGSKKEHIEKAARLIIKKKIFVNDLITNIFKISNYKKAFNQLKSGKSTKIIIKPS